MKALSVTLALLLAAGNPALAQLPTTGVGAGAAIVTGGGGGYTGPGDVIGSAVAWYGLRAYSAAYATALGNAVELCTASDALCTVIHVTSTGVLNSSDLTTSGCSGITTCTVKTFHDQSGNGHDCSKASISVRPTFNPNGISTGVPSIHFGAGSNRELSCASIASTATPWTFTLTALSAATPAGNERAWNVPDPRGILAGTSDHWTLNAGSNGASTVTNGHSTFYRVIAGTDGTGSGGKISVSSTVTSSLAVGSTSAGGTGSFGSAGSGNINGDIFEGGLWGSLFSAGNFTAMDSNMATGCGC